MKKNESPTPEADRKLRGLESLNQVEHDALLAVFEPLVNKKMKYFTLKGKRRKEASYQERSNISLPGAEQKLSFILMYMKENPNQAYHGFAFGMAQSKVSEWISFLSPVLEEALIQMGFMPQCGDRWQYRGEQTDYFIADVTERQVPRRSDHDAQQEEYSGKKKDHTMKNLAITDEYGYVRFLSTSYEGTVHDKAIWDELHLEQTDHNMLLDLGFVGVEHEFPNAILPFKKPRKAELTPLQKQINHVISKLRIRIEHAFAGVKRLKIIRNKIRLKSFDARDQMMRIATALHNLRWHFRGNLKIHS